MPEPANDRSAGQLSRARRLVVLAICCFSLLMVGLDTTIVNVALPSIRNDLHASISGLQWVIDAYTLVLASLLMLAGSTADRIGRKRIFRSGLVVFSAGSLLCGLAPTLGTLLAARVVQAVGGSMLNPVALSIVRNVFEDPRERAQAIGAWGAVFGLSIALGPVIGGALVDSVGWRWVFFVNVPIGVLAFVLTTLYVPRSRAARARRLDPVGQVLVILALASLTYAIIDAPSAGWTSGGTLGLFAFSVVCFAAFVAYELRRREPLIEMRFFRSAPFSGASAIAVCAFAATGGFLFLNTLYLQGVRHLSPFHAGLYMLPMAGMVLVCAPISGRLVSRRGARPSLVVAGIALTVASFMLTRLTPDTATGYLFVAYLVFGIGSGIGQSADHQHRGVRDARRPGRRGRGHRLDQPAGGDDARRGRARRDLRRRDLRGDRARLRGRDALRVVGMRRARRDHSGARRPDHHGLGGADRAGHRRAPQRRRAAAHAEPAMARRELAPG